MRLIAVAVALGAVGAMPARAVAKGDDDAVTVDDAEDEEVEEDQEDEEDEEDESIVVADSAPKQESEGDDFKKQDLRGHDVGASTKKNLFEKDRFFVDKVDTKKTRKSTLVQGSVTASSFAYKEFSGDATEGVGSAASRFSRYFTDLRLQTDFRHIAGSKWDARVDVRGRVVNHPDNNLDAQGTPDAPTIDTNANHVQSGFNGRNELDIRELFLVRSGKRSDVVVGRQFINDLGAIKIDGLRVDYARSESLTLIGFGGMFPLRGSRSIRTDYITLKDNQFNDAGRFVAAGGFGGAYRTVNAHGAVGGVVLAPLPGADESPRVSATSNGYYRSAKQFDLYHFAIVDLVGSQGFALTNLSGGINYRPNARLRLNASFNRVDTETLAVQANAFLDRPFGSAPLVVQNDSYFLRLASNQARAGISAGLGELQRFEITSAVTYRFRPGVVLLTPDNTRQVGLQAAQSVEVYFSVIDRRSIKDLRLGADAMATFAVGDVAYQRSEVTAVRVFMARELKSGRGEWDAEVGYTRTKDSAIGTSCTSPMGTTIFGQDACFGTSSGTILSIGGNAFYRINRDWFALGSAFVSRIAITPTLPILPNMPADPAITGLTGFFRIAYRF